MAGAGVALVTFALAVLVAPGRAIGAVPLGAFAGVALVGGGFGLIVGPVVAWTLLRRVPLGRAVLIPTIGAAIGSALGLALAPLSPLAVLGAGLAGLFLGAWRERRRFPAGTGSAAIRIESDGDRR